MIDSDDLDRLSKLCDAATRIPWILDDDERVETPGPMIQAGTVYDAQFIAAAREWMPKLIARVRELERGWLADKYRDAAKELDKARAEVERLQGPDAPWAETAKQEMRNAVYYRANQLALQGGMRRAMNELGVPQPDYPAPVANAYDHLAQALEQWGIVDGLAVHADDCTKDPCKCTEPNEEL